MPSASKLRDCKFTDDMPVMVSICSISFNHAPYIRQCLEGFLDQECAFRVEIIICDDASSDGTSEIIREYSEKYPSLIRPILQQDNQYSKGVNPYYSYVFPATKGRYIALCDGDDYWDDPQKLALQTSVLETESDVVVTYGPVKAVTENGIREDYKNGAERDLSPSELKIGLPINTLTACFRNVMQETPPAFLRSAPMGDMTVWAMLGHHGRGKFLHQLQKAGYREHDGGIFSTVDLQQKLFMGTITLLNMAAYHYSKSDMAGSRACMKRVLGQIVMLNGGKFSVLEVVRKSFSLGIKKLRS